MVKVNLETDFSSLQGQHPSIKLYTPDSADYATLTKTYVASQAKPGAIARPQTAEDVQALVRLAVDKNLDFNVRSGGHNCVGRTLVNGALLIDMRDIASVTVSEDKKTARVGGGILTGDLLKALEEHGSVTPCGSVGSIGYVGWSTNGGYGPFSTLHGLGVDQIVGAKLVTSKGELIDAPDELLKGIRGAGTIFGVIVELTIKVYPLKEMLFSILVYDSGDIPSAWTGLTEGINSLTLPPALNIHIFAMYLGGLGKQLVAIATWVDDNHEEGRKLIDKVGKATNCSLNTTTAKTVTDYTTTNDKLVTFGNQGRSYALNLKKWTPTSASVLAKYHHTIPSEGSMISIHSLRTPESNEDSVFGAREDHIMVDIVAITSDPALKDETAVWGQGLVSELRKKDSQNILDSAYISLIDYDDIDLKKIYGKHLNALISLKKKYDPDNIFKHSAPKIIV